MLGDRRGLGAGAAGRRRPAAKSGNKYQGTLHFLVPVKRHLNMAAQGEDVGGAVGMEFIGAQGALRPLPGHRLMARGSCSA